jgi:hypothetical protein
MQSAIGKVTDLDGWSAEGVTPGAALHFLHHFLHLALCSSSVGAAAAPGIAL